MTEAPSRDEAVERMRLVAGAHPLTDEEARQLRRLLEVEGDLVWAARTARALKWLMRVLAWLVLFFVASFQASEYWTSWAQK